jgi:polysaccharide biosynthesis/export protein
MFRVLMLMVFLCALPMWCQANDYVIGDGDTLSVSVWGASELSVTVIVRPDGKITLPAVGDVKATGLTPKQLSDDLVMILDSFIKKPIVTVTVTAITNNRVYVSGGGVPSQVINLTGRTTLFKLLCSLEGIENADMVNAYLVRGGKRLEIDFFGLFVKGQVEKDIVLRPEDILYLPTNENNKVYVVGAVNTPRYLIYRQGIRIFDAILEAGGFSKFARQNAVLLLRTIDGQEERIRINITDLMKNGDLTQNIELRRGDYVIVQEGMF